MLIHNSGGSLLSYPLPIVALKLNKKGYNTNLTQYIWVRCLVPLECKRLGNKLPQEYYLLYSVLISALIYDIWFLADELSKQQEKNTDENTNIWCNLKCDPFSFDYRNLR